MPKFEYMVLELRLYANEVSLNAYGSNGWQLVSESIHEDQIRYVFSRPKQP